MDPDSHINPSFSTEIAAERMRKVLEDFTLLTNKSGFSLSAADIETQSQAREDAHRLIDDYFGMMAEKTAERRANLERYAGVRFISLGEDCLGRTIPTQWGLKPCAALGERTHPFDLAVHPLPRVVQCIESDFSGYLDANKLSYDPERNFCVNEPLNIRYNHEKGPEYAADGFSKLLENYRRRIGNFRDSLAQPGPVVFILRLLRPRPNAWQHLRKLIALLQDRRKGSRNLLLCVNTSDSPEISGVHADSPREGEPLRIIHAAYPYQGYVWYVSRHCFSPEGHRFEKQLVDRIKAEVDAWL
jgi:hypothetical protein